MYPEPLEASKPSEAKGYWVVWKEMKKNKETKIYEHTITLIDKEGVEIKTGVVFSVRDYWKLRNIIYTHPALKYLKEPGQTEYAAIR